MQSQNNFISSREMRAIEINAEYFGIQLLQLMEIAGRNVSQEITTRFPKDKNIIIICGLGGNGGDGFVTARHLLTEGFKVSILIAGRARDITHQATLQNYTILQSLQTKIPITEITDSTTIPDINADIIIDALLGTGAKGKLRAPIQQIVEAINTAKGFKLAIDIPTGIDSDSGEVQGTAVQADLTVTFHKPKKGLEKANRYTGKVIVSSIGLPSELERFAGPGDVQMVLKPRNPAAHKGDFGRLLVIGGNEIYFGAPVLVSLAAMRTGVDLIYLATPQKNATPIASLSPDLITIKLQGDNLNPDNIATLKPFIKIVDIVALGPGLGLDVKTQEFVKVCIDEVEAAGKTLLLDADGLKAFASFKRALKVPLVLTPHVAEYVLLAGTPLPEAQEEQISAIQKTAKSLNATILLKNRVDLICDSNRVKLNFTGNAGMTVGGTGDVLCGIVAGLMALHADPFEAAVAGAFVNGAAGDFVALERGYHMTATDIIEWIAQVLETPMDHLKVKKSHVT
ncbi:MAG: NAD(P)H-hydrate dehydratase [Nitrososphaerota archaeon]|jgi:NAD(P)H-hydrate epimerase|nr:NAD(P)H-hydrate dehydratase [Nitrososphaerota archaeon]